jgi:hypothetical protein
MNGSSEKKYLLAGGSGMVGRALQKHLQKLGHKTFVLSTNEKKCDQELTYYWNPSTQTIHLPAGISFDAVINLAGANIADKLWSNRRKIELLESRTASTQFLCSLISSGHIASSHLVQLSAIGYYGDRGNSWCEESSAKGNGFLSDLTAMWEKSCTIPASVLRLGIVFDKSEGAFPKMIASIPFYIATIFGNGDQYVSWIDLNDLCDMILYCADQKLTGVYNAVSSNPLTYRDCLRSFALTQNKKPIELYIPKKFFKMITKDFYELFYFSQRISNDKIKKEGFKFKCEDFTMFCK